MNKFAILLSGAAAIMGAQAANATTYTPAGTHTLTGTVDVSKSLGTYTCTLTVTINVPEAAPDAHGTFSHGHSATVTSAVLSGGFPCGAIGVAITNGGVITFDDSVSLPKIIVNGVSISAPLSGGTCDGTLTGRWDNATRTLYFNPPESNVATCKIDGSITATGPLSITNP